MVLKNETDEAIALKEKGNEAYSNKEWNHAITAYGEALQHAVTDELKVILYKNRAATMLKLEKFEEAVEEATKALEVSPNDPKALYRRCEALERLNKMDEAYLDACKAFNVDPTNKDVQSMLAHLHEKVQAIATTEANVGNKIRKMFGYAFENGTEKQRETALDNILVLAKEANSARALYEAGVVEKLKTLTKGEGRKYYEKSLRIISSLCGHRSLTKPTLSKLGIDWFFEAVNSDNQDRVNACQGCLQAVLNALTGMGNDDKKPVETLCQENKAEIESILTSLVYRVTSHSLCGLARDSIIEVITRNVHYEAVNWAQQLVDMKGVQRLLEVVSELPEYGCESSMKTTASTKTLVSVCLARVYESMYYDDLRAKFVANVDEFVKELLLAPDSESKVKAVAVLTTLLLGPNDVGNAIVTREGIVDMILAMATVDEELQQRVACECLVAVITKPDKAQMVISKGLDVLKGLYERGATPGVKVRALVGLCKAASSGGSDAAMKPMPEGSAMKLALACKECMMKAEAGEKKWAAEGFSYLTFDATVKEFLIGDEELLKTLIDVARMGDVSAVYGIVSTFVNLCNAYDKKEILPEMVELAKFAKRHVPEEHEMDGEAYVDKRIDILGRMGITTGLVTLSKTESDNCKELICRVFNALCGRPHLRGLVVQQGGVKVLINMALNGTEMGKRLAGQALSRIGITTNPETAFPGQRCMEVIRPLLWNLQPDCSALTNFEALMALCNLASVSDAVREHIVKENGLSKIEAYLYENHVMLRRAATQCFTNLVLSESILKAFEGDNDRLKFLFLSCDEEDEETSMAAAGAVAVLTRSEKCCDKIFRIKDWPDIVKCMLVSEQEGRQHRGVVITYNLIGSGKRNAEKVVETDIMEVLMALSVKEGVGASVKEIAGKCLKCAEDMNVIKKAHRL